jgi:hypothetical protein
MGMNDSRPLKTRRRWLRFSLRTLLLFVVLWAAWLGLWLKPRIDRARRQEKAVDAIVALGGTIFYDYQKSEHGSVNSQRASPVPGWVRAIFGEHFCVDVIWVYLGGTDVDASILEKLWPEIERLDRLEHLQLVAHHVVDDAALRQLVDAVPPSLKGLNLTGAQVTDDGLASLESLRALKSVALKGVPITDDGLEHLVSLKSLLWLDLTRTNITDEGLMKLVALPNLRQVLVDQTRVTEAGRQAFQKATPQEISFWPEE